MNTKKLYLLERDTQGKAISYDEYLIAVVVACSDDDAVKIHPNGNLHLSDDGEWVDEDERPDSGANTWTDIIKVTYIGQAARNLKVGSVVCSSFHAG